MKVKSLQYGKPDCMLHALVNAGVCKNYKEALRLNKYFKIIAKGNRFVLNEYMESGIFCIPHFLELVLSYKNINYVVTKNKRVDRISKKTNGIAVIDCKVGYHAVAIRDGHVIDSRRKHSVPFQKYRHKKIVKLIDIL